MVLPNFSWHNCDKIVLYLFFLNSFWGCFLDFLDFVHIKPIQAAAFNA